MGETLGWVRRDVGVGERAAELAARGCRSCSARVVLAEKPTSARPGDEALVLADGTMEGFVGGDCAEATVRAQALAVLDSGEPVVLRISADGRATQAGKVMAHNPCLSGGSLEIYLEPRHPPPRMAVVGDGPIARALRDRQRGRRLRGGRAPATSDLAALVVASHGRDEAAPLSAALKSGVDYVGLVASPKRGAAVRGSVDVAGAERIVTPAGFDIGARTPEEVALSICADVSPAAPDPRPGRSRREPPPSAEVAIDPVCGMTVAAVESSLHLDHEGRRYWFCGTGCLRAFAAEPDRYSGT